MKINTQYLLEQHKMNKMGMSKMVPRYIAIHNTANIASAKNEALNVYNNNWRSGANGVSFHFAVDEKDVYQIVRADYNAWHASDGYGAGNMSALAIEIAKSKDYKSDNYYKAEVNAAKLTALLMKQFNIPLQNIKRHYDFDTVGRKKCPHRMFEDNSWNKFLEMVDQAYKGETITHHKLHKNEWVILPAKAGRVRIYDANARTKIGNEKGFLNPGKFNGLSYKIIDRPTKNTVLIRTKDYGISKLYIRNQGIKVVDKKPKKKEYVLLPKKVKRVRVYKPNTRIKVGNEIGFLAPKDYKGLVYLVRSKPSKRAVIIKTKAFGEVKLFTGNQGIKVVKSHGRPKKI